jgi:hypothetical protein
MVTMNCCSTNYGYQAVDVVVKDNVDHITLKRIDSNSSMFGGDFQHISMEITYVSDWLLRVKVCSTDAF